MDRAKINDFLYSMSRKRFLEILKEFAESLGLDGKIFERVSAPYLANLRTLNDVLAEYPDRQIRSRAGSLLRAGKAVQNEIDQHFKTRHKENTKALIDEMPTDRDMRLRLQIEYVLQQFGGVDTEALSELKEVRLLRGELLQSVRKVEQLKVDREQINKDIQQMVQAALSSRFGEIEQLRREMKSQQDELKRVRDQVEESKTNAAPIDGSQSAYDSIESGSRLSDSLSSEVKALISETVSGLGIDDLRSSLAAQRNDFEVWKHLQADLKERLDKLERQVGGIADRLTDQAVEHVINSLEELKSSFQAQLEGAKEETNGHRKQISEEVAALSSRLDKLWSGNGSTLEESLSLKSELLACIVVKEINRVEQFLEAARKEVSGLDGIKQASDPNVLQEELEMESVVEALQEDIKVTKEFIELVKLYYPKASSRRRDRE